MARTVEPKYKRQAGDRDCRRDRCDGIASPVKIGLGPGLDPGIVTLRCRKCGRDSYQMLRPGPALDRMQMRVKALSTAETAATGTG